MTHLKLIAATLALALAYLAGSTVQAHIDERAVTVAHQNEMQANGRRGRVQNSSGPDAPHSADPECPARSRGAVTMLRTLYYLARYHWRVWRQGKVRP